MILTMAGALNAGGAFSVTPSAGSPRFYDDDPLWREADTQDASGMQSMEIDLAYDIVETSFARPGDPKPNVRAQNVNTIDEAPDSSWFTNRIGVMLLTADDVATGPNTGPGPAPGRWTVGSKRDGITPGFTITDTTGQRWFIKFDPPGYRGMGTGTEVAVTKLFWALGYFVPENYVASLRRENLDIGARAMFKPAGAGERLMTPEDVDRIVALGAREPDGSYRVMASKALPGKPVGRFRYYGTRPDDPNDVVPHEHRRELRGLGVFAAWLNHVDAKSVNTLDTLISENGRSYVRHSLIDFGSTVGSAAVMPREHWEGYENLYEGPSEIGLGIIGLGFYVRLWRTVDYFDRPAIGRFPADNRKWDPEAWKPRAPNPAFLRARLDDKFWAARKLMRITDDMIRAAVRAGQFGDERAEAFLARALVERRDAIGRSYLPAVNPIVDPALDASGMLTFGNAAVDAGFAAAPELYRATWSIFDNATGETRPLGETKSAATRMSAPRDLPAQAGSFVKIELSGHEPAHPAWDKPVHVYFRRTAQSAWTLVGFERQPD
jgi:hypothetical protein